MRKIISHSTLVTNHPLRSISLFSLALVFYLLTAQGHFFERVFGPGPRPVAHKQNTQWENIQSTVIENSGNNIFAKPVTLNLDQVRNGSADDPVVPPTPAPWVNGNAGASNAHYVEGYSIPYRVVIENLAGTGLRSVDIEWDARQSNSSAIDFITNYDMIDFPAGSHVFNFSHPKEVINPISESGTWVSGSKIDILAPPNLPAAPLATFNAINAAGLGQFGVWNADLDSMKYISESNYTAASGSTRIRIFFTNKNSSPVIISWGGHIARAADWGPNNSASAVSGSPYHTRLIQWDPDGDASNGVTSVGNQDRSLSADAVLDPPKCTLQGPSSMECNSTATFNSGVTSTDLTAGVTYEWSIPTGSDNASFCGTTVEYACVTANKTSCASGAEFTVRFRLLKNGAEISRCNQEVDITDNTPPTIINVGGPQTIDCPASPTFSSPTATDACTTASISSSDNSVTSCGNARTVTRTWTARDACGNTSTASQTITIRDITAPVIYGVGSNQTISCPANPVFSTPTASDACSASTFTPTYTDETTVSCGQARTVKRKWTATDDCGNTATASQTITVTDNTGPVISGVGSNQTISCPEEPVFSTPTASDACGASTFTPTFTDQTTNSCGQARTVKRTWTAVDDCGNSTTASQTITVTDNIAPVISGVGGPQTISCPAEPVFSTPTASDACGASTFTPTYTDQTTNSCGQARTVTRKWTAADACGNTSTASQTITVVDNTPPQITCPGDATIDCNASTAVGAEGIGSATATDACGGSTLSSNDQTVNTGCVTVITRTWTARDACGNTATCVQHIVKKDLLAPVITCNADGSATASDNCGDLAAFYLSGGVWTAIDQSGNISTKSCPVEAGRVNPSLLQTEEQQQQQLQTKEEDVSKTLQAPKATTQKINGITVQAFPNPFNDKVKFVITAPEAGYGSLDVMNMIGQKIKTVFQGQLNAGSQSFEMSLPASRFSTLFYIFRMNGKQVTGKLIQRN